MVRAIIRLVGTVLLCAVIIGAVAMFVLHWLLPKLSYRKIALSITGDSSVSSAEYIKDGMSITLTEDQTNAVVAWIAEYRSDNEGVERLASIDKSGVEIRITLKNGDAIALYPDRMGICFKGILGKYRIIKTECEIYDSVSRTEWENILNEP